MACLVVLMGLGGCSENFGPPPPDGGRRIEVVSEGFEGPRVPRVASSAMSGGGVIALGTDGGLYAIHLVGGSPVWRPAHGGSLTGINEGRVGRVLSVNLDRFAERWLVVSALGPTIGIAASLDGGTSFVRVDVADPTNPTILGATLVEVGLAWPDGAFAIVQGVRLYVRPATETGSWESIDLPSAPIEVGAIYGDGMGEFVLGVRDSQGWKLWTARRGDTVAVDSQLTPGGRVLAVALDDGLVEHAEQSGIFRDGVQTKAWPGTLEVVSFITGFRTRFAGIGMLDAGGRGRFEGEIGGVTLGPLPLTLPDPPVALTNTPTGWWVVLDDASLYDLRADRLHSSQTFEFDWSAIASSHAGGDHVALGRLRTGEVFEGPAAETQAYSSLGTPPFSSTSGALLADPAMSRSWYAGSFGVQRGDRSSGQWQVLNDGQFSYDPTLFAGPVAVSALEALSGDTLWLGSLNGDGPYRSTNAGQFWERVQGGLGVPGSYALEFGLPNVSQVRAFAEDSAGRTWMGGFRGGVWRLDETDVWINEVRGLPRIESTIVDTCCTIPGELEVDVRDLVRLGNGSLLAATGWGVFRRNEALGRWENQSLGLANLDVRALAVHPTRSDVVAAASTGHAGNPDWLFLSEDGGRTWLTVDTSLVAKSCIGLVWSRPSRTELVALLQAEGAWRLELSP